MGDNMKLAATGVLLASIGFLRATAAQAVTERVLYSFQGGSDGANPTAELMLPPSPRNVLLGTTDYGGPGGGGTVYSINTRGGTEVVEASFPSGYGPRASLTYVPDFGFYGTTVNTPTGYGCIYTLSYLLPCLAEMKGQPSDSADPYGTMVWLKSSALNGEGALYGTTRGGGTYNVGSIFYYSPTYSIHYDEIYVFCQQTNCADGELPVAGLIAYEGLLYGTTTSGGTITGAGYGTIFSFDPTAHKEILLYSFNGTTDGAAPAAPLLNYHGALYGTTEFEGKYGTASGGGTLFAYNKGIYTVYHDFCSQGTNCADGSVPMAGLIRDKSTLYGTTEYGGSNTYGGTNGGGTVFSLDLSSGNEVVLYSFCSQTNCTDGANPMAKLLMVGGKLYGTTLAGGTGPCSNTGSYANGCGTVFEITR